MDRRPLIHMIVYVHGLVKDTSELQGLKTEVLEGANLTREIVSAVFDNDLLSAGGVHGNPLAGDPVEITSLKITHQRGVTEVTVFNLGMMLFHTNNDIYPRVLRICSAIEKQTGRRSSVKALKDSDVPASLAEPGGNTRPLPGQGSTQVYQIKVVLLETTPPIWRCFVVPSTVTLHRLHLILQEVMGWTNSHLYRFQIGTKEYGEPDPDNEFDELDFKNSRRAKLHQVMAKKGGVLRYEYDFGDSWDHMLMVEDILDRDPRRKYPFCVTGERACPPEDCGGTYGYAELLEIIADPEHEDHEDMMTWLGGHFYPDRFDIDAANKRLRSMRV